VNGPAEREGVVNVRLSAKFAEAVAYAVEAHGDQVRKGTDIPYAAHLLAVSALVLEAGGTEVQAIAALLHDAPEDCGGQPRLDDVRREFGDDVANIVEACSDSLTEDPTQKAPSLERKQAYLDHLAGAPPDALLVSLADKLHNATSIARDLRAIGPMVFERFSVSRDETIAYYRQLVVAFAGRRSDLTAGGQALMDEFRTVVEQFDAGH
jgi:(p)ppGpp synthase/HD superfamily hydrolase